MGRWLWYVERFKGPIVYYFPGARGGGVLLVAILSSEPAIYIQREGMLLCKISF